MSSERNLSSFGDVLLNFLYSLAKSEVSMRYEGERVKNHVLARALSNSKVEVPRRLDKHGKGDFVENFIAKAWIEKLISTKEAVEILKSSLSRCGLEREEDAMVEGFSKLLDEIERRKGVSK
ncbi:MAG: ribonuclease III family protein [Candidatus Methanofastidiosia archaeon]